MKVVSTLMISTGTAFVPKVESEFGEGLTVLPMNQLEPRPHVDADARVVSEIVNVSVLASMLKCCMEVKSFALVSSSLTIRVLDLELSWNILVIASGFYAFSLAFSIATPRKTAAGPHFSG